MSQADKKTEPYCVVVGGINIDVQAFCLAAYTEGDSNPGRIERSLGGVGRNIAENLVRLGLRTEMITVLGSSPGWDKLVSRTERAGIGLSHSPRLPGAPLPAYLCILEDNGDLVGAVADMRAVERMRVEHLESQKSLLDKAAAIIVDGNIPQPCIEWIAERYRAGGNGGPCGVNSANSGHHAARPLLVADPVSSAKARRFKACFGRFDIAKPNIAEATVIAGFDGEVPIQRLISAMVEASSLPGELYVSRGEGGMEVVDHGSATDIPLPPPQRRPHSVNRSGAGDAACAALVWASVHAGSAGLRPQDKAKIALSAALHASSSKHPVNPELNEESLCETAINCYPELSGIVDAIQHGGKT